MDAEHLNVGIYDKVLVAIVLSADDGCQDIWLKVQKDTQVRTANRKLLSVTPLDNQREAVHFETSAVTLIHLITLIITSTY